MSGWLIVLVVFIALSPLLAIMPTRRQKQVVQLQEGAAVRGMFVQLRKLPVGEPGEEKFAFYGRRRGQEGWDERYDLFADGVVDFGDLEIFDRLWPGTVGAGEE